MSKLTFLHGNSAESSLGGLALSAVNVGAIGKQCFAPIRIPPLANHYAMDVTPDELKVIGRVIVW
jgi:hypothetical protein